MKQYPSSKFAAQECTFSTRKMSIATDVKFVVHEKLPSILAEVCAEMSSECNYGKLN